MKWMVLSMVLVFGGLGGGDLPLAVSPAAAAEEKGAPSVGAAPVLPSTPTSTPALQKFVGTWSGTEGLGTERFYSNITIVINGDGTWSNAGQVQSGGGVYFEAKGTIESPAGDEIRLIGTYTQGRYINAKASYTLTLSGSGGSALRGTLLGPRGMMPVELKKK